MRLNLRDELLFAEVTLVHRRRSITLTDVIIDTGSAASVFSAERLAEIGLVPEADDTLIPIRGIGGQEAVVEKRIDRLILGEFVVDDFTIQIGGMDYGPDLEGIIGLDFLLRVGAVIDLAKLEIRRQ